MPDTLRPVRIHVCTTCREAGVKEGVPAGASLCAALVKAASPGVAVESVTCLGNCRRGCTVAMKAPGTWTYVFGDLDADGAPDVLAAARLLAGGADGLMPWRGRPETFKRGLIARIPPVSIREAAE